MSVVSYSIDDKIAVLTIHNPPINAISQPVRQGLIDQVGKALDDPDAEAILITCRERTFCAGADIAEFDQPLKRPSLNDAFNFIEQSTKPVIAAQFGSVLGGGLELAMACHYRTALSTTKFGQPEVALGIIPGAGGTQRLARLVGLDLALSLITGGRPITADKALEAGLIDKIVGDDLVGESLTFAREIVAAERGVRPTQKLAMPSDQAEELFDKYRGLCAKTVPGQIAPLQAIEAIAAGQTLSFDDALAKETQIFRQLKEGEQSLALRHMFFAEREVKKIPGLDKRTPVRDIKEVGIVGAGTMGTGIATACLQSGFAVTLIERNYEALGKGKVMIEKNLASAVNKGRLSQDKADQMLSRLQASTDYDALGKADLIIEAAYEEIGVKEQVFTELDRVAKEGAIMATNTSFLNVNHIAQFTKRPQDVLGTHFFSPAHVMKLLEIVRGAATADDVLATAIHFSSKIGKTGVVAGVCHGFIGNRMLEGYMREAGLMLLEGASPVVIDKALTDFGLPMGIYAMIDMAGLDICASSRHGLSEDLYNPLSTLVIEALVSEGRLGQKSRAGFYSYAEDPHKPTADGRAMMLAQRFASEHNIAQREISDEEIIERCLLAMANIGGDILEEGIAIRSGDIDVIYVYGYGFPRHKGGPMFYAEQMGNDKVVTAIETYKDRYGPKWWTPSSYFTKAG